MRSRITITISEDLLEQVDQTINNRTVRNRSQAIEALLRQVLQPSVTTAVLLAGGSLTKHPQADEQIPKALIPIKGRPVIVHLLNQLKKHRFNKVIVCTSPDSADLVKAELRDGREFGLEIIYSDEPEKLGTGGALKHAKKHIPNQPFLMLHGDVLTDINLTDLVSYFHQSETKAVLAVKPRPGRLSYGRVFLEGNTVVDFQVPQESSPISLVNTGIYIFGPEVLEWLPETKKFKIEDTVIPELVKHHEAVGCVFQGIWFDVSDPESYDEANERWS